MGLQSQRSRISWPQNPRVPRCPRNGFEDREPYVYVMVGPRGSGKTYIVRTLFGLPIGPYDEKTINNLTDSSRSNGLRVIKLATEICTYERNPNGPKAGTVRYSKVHALWLEGTRLVHLLGADGHVFAASIFDLISKYTALGYDVVWDAQPRNVSDRELLNEIAKIAGVVSVSPDAVLQRCATNVQERRARSTRGKVGITTPKEEVIASMKDAARAREVLMHIEVDTITPGMPNMVEQFRNGLERHQSIYTDRCVGR